MIGIAPMIESSAMFTAMRAATLPLAPCLSMVQTSKTRHKRSAHIADARDQPKIGSIPKRNFVPGS